MRKGWHYKRAHRYVTETTKRKQTEIKERVFFQKKRKKKRKEFHLNADSSLSRLVVVCIYAAIKLLNHF